MEAYKNLIDDHPPMAIESEENEQALAITGELMKKEALSPAERKLLRSWIALIAEYEKRAYPRTFEKSSGRETLQFLMEENSLTQKNIPGIPQSRVSDILAGRRGIGKEQAKILGSAFTKAGVVSRSIKDGILSITQGRSFDGCPH